MVMRMTEKEFNERFPKHAKREKRNEPHAEPTPTHYRVIPPTKYTYPEPKAREQYTKPIGPTRETTVERIKRVATGAGVSVGRAVNQVASNPTVQKAGRIVKERSDAFQENVSFQHREPAPRQHQKSAARGRAPKPQPAPQRQAAQDDPFGIHGIVGGGFQKKKPPGGDNPFGLRR